MAKDRRAFRDCPNFASKAKILEVFKEIITDVVEHGLLPEVFDILLFKVHVFEEIQRLLQARRQEEAALGGKGSHEQLKTGVSRKVILEIGCRHGEFIQIGDQSRTVLSSLSF